MKLSLRILLINFIVVAIVLMASAFVFYSLLYNSLNSQQTQNLINSTNSFIYSYQKLFQDAEEELFVYLDRDIKAIFEKHLLTGSNVDFILETSTSNFNPINRFATKSNVIIPSGNFDIKKFVESNPFSMIRKKQIDNRIYYYGKVANSDFLNDLSQRINSDIALIWESSAAEVSNSSVNKKYFYLLSNAYNFLKTKNNYATFVEGTDASDILATLYQPLSENIVANNLSFLIFRTHGEAATLRATLRNVLIIIGLVGVIVSLILAFILTDKIRKQLTDLSSATEATRSGDFNKRIVVKSSDEIGKLGEAFNLMLNELDKNLKAKNEYSDFITLINQNPSLLEISDAALKKIIKTGGFLVGALYTVDDGEINLICSYGLSQDDLKKEDNDFYKRVISTKEKITIKSSNLLPVISTGTVDIKIKYLLILPIVYTNKVISLLELGSVEEPSDEALEYLSKIQEQLAIGLTNAKAVVQMEDFISELRKLNEETQKQNLKIKKQNDTLLELSEQLQEKARELELQKEKAEESTKLKSQFLASMSHELRTPMNSILGLTELILEKAQLDGRNKERLEVVFKSGKRLMTLINDILDLSKIEAGKMELRNEDVLLEEIVEEVSNTINPLAIEKSLSFVINRDCNTRVIINTDRGRIVQILINLLGNAVKFTDKGKVELALSVTESKMLKFSVIDSGIGIPEDQQKIIFEEFRQVDGSTTRKYSGTGLGLAICKKIVDLLGGEIWVESKMSRGSNFSFTIPFSQIIEKHDDTALINVEALRKNIKNPILVIDDDPEIRYTIGQYLISKGYDVIFAEDGEKGLKIAIEKQPFAITLDVMLPNRDGWSILKDLKDRPETKDIPVILISIMGDKNLGYGLGAFEYFIKPISADKLLSAFNRLETLAKKRLQKIVIVDDDELEFEKFKREFKNENISIEYIQDSEYAFNKIAEVEPDLIILDLLMPKIDGITLSYKLKSNPLTKHIPIIISTAKDLTDDERKSLNSIVEEITVKSKGHPLDVLKIVRDRIKVHEESQIIDVSSNGQLGNKDDEKAAIDLDTQSDFLGDVLIVDDDPDTLFTINEIVQTTGCKTYLARNGKECLRMLDHMKPDLILLDIMMPEMDGFQTLTNIKLNNKLSDIPVYAVTAKAMAGDKEIILKHGFNDYIPKPVNSTIITAKIGQLLSKIKAS